MARGCCRSPQIEVVPGEVWFKIGIELRAIIRMSYVEFVVGG